MKRVVKNREKRPGVKAKKNREKTRLKMDKEEQSPSLYEDSVESEK